uniref:Carboxypeptidase n=1 Tax=Cucumis melo TaxID=3656 RepID=A0A9I9CK27_CUCME
MNNQFHLLLLSFLLFFGHPIHARPTSAFRSNDGSEEWGYVRVRPKAHMFWWLYRSPYRVENPSKPWPIILWLQGGPGASGVGIGNFKEVGPLDASLKPRNSTWLHKADLLFVLYFWGKDNPVGTGYSFVEDTNSLVKSDLEAATDLTTLLQAIFNRDQTLQKSPLYIVAESYGGKYAVTLGLSALKAIEAGRLKLTLGEFGSDFNLRCWKRAGVVLGDSWISPQDYTVATVGLEPIIRNFDILLNPSKYIVFVLSSWGPLLKDLSRLDDIGVAKSNSIAKRIEEEIEKGEFVAATSSWSELEDVISASSNGVDFYNFLLDSGADSVSSERAMDISNGVASMRRYSRYLSSLRTTVGGDSINLYDLMNGGIRKKLKIIPDNLQMGWAVRICFPKSSTRLHETKN